MHGLTCNFLSHAPFLAILFALSPPRHGDAFLSINHDVNVNGYGVDVALHAMTQFPKLMHVAKQLLIPSSVFNTD